MIEWNIIDLAIVQYSQNAKQPHMCMVDIDCKLRSANSITITIP